MSVISIACRVAAPGLAELVQLRGGPDELLAGEEGVDRVAFGHQPETAVDLGILPGRLAGVHGKVPFDGARKPAIMCKMVDLPAPFGPSRPVTPGPMSIVMSLTATTLPYQRLTF